MRFLKASLSRQTTHTQTWVLPDLFSLYTRCKWSRWKEKFFIQYFFRWHIKRRHIWDLFPLLFIYSLSVLVSLALIQTFISFHFTQGHWVKAVPEDDAFKKNPADFACSHETLTVFKRCFCSLMGFYIALKKLWGAGPRNSWDPGRIYFCCPTFLEKQKTNFDYLCGFLWAHGIYSKTRGSISAAVCRCSISFMQMMVF